MKLNPEKIKAVLFILVIWILLLFSVMSYGQQVGINNPTPHVKALLDLTSSDKGILVPRMSEAQRVAMFPVADPTAAGMMVYQTNNDKGFWYYDGVTWVSVSSDA